MWEHLHEVKRRSKESANSDLWTDRNIAPKPNAEKGCNALVTLEGKQALIDLTLPDLKHYQISCDAISWEGGLTESDSMNTELTCVVCH